MRHRLEYLLVQCVRRLVQLLPDGLVPRVGAGVGRLYGVIDRRRRRIARDNVAAALPSLSVEQRRAIVGGAFAHFGRLLFELLKFSTLTPDAMLARVEFEGADHVRAAHAQGKGVIFVTGHFGYWELQALVHALQLPPMAVLARPLDNPLLHDLLEQVRTRTGNRVIYRSGAIRHVLRTLHAGGAVGILIDQHMLSADAIMVNFFNRPAATTSALAMLALKTGAPVVPLFALPLGKGRYRMVYEPPVEPPGGEGPEVIRAFTQRCTDVLERYVRERPDLWLWMHRRWRS